jgi:pre-mRNA-splicing factor ATP-dependent RNA helicase DHX38/PRP16
VKSSDWDYATPQVKASGYEEISLEYPEENVDGSERMKWEEEQAQLDRDWYQMEENGAMDETHNPFAEYEVHDHEKEEELAQKQIVSLCTCCLCPYRSCSNHNIPQKKLSARQAQYNKDTEMWEASRMLSSGIAQRREVDTDFDDENEVSHCAVCDWRILAHDD